MERGTASRSQKARLLLPMLLRDPVQLGQRVRTILESRADRLVSHPGHYRPQGLEATIAGICSAVDADVLGHLDEPALAEITADVRARVARNEGRGPFAQYLNADPALAHLCYAVVRAMRPAVVLETGVGYGVTSAFILQALEANGAGVLHSVDLAPLALGAEHSVGSLIPPDLRARWRLHRGGSRTILPRLLPSIAPVDVFVHDSVHTYWHMAWELRTVRRHLAPQGAVLSDDVEGNRAFEEFVTRESPAFWAAVQEVEKPGLCGVALFIGERG
jgi:methyltransferase family protein